MLFSPPDSSSRGTPRSPAVLWTLIAGTLLTYVAGVLTQALASDDFPVAIAGTLLIILSIVLAGLVTSSTVARLAGEYEKELDEYERVLSSDALSLAYRRLGFLILLLAAYAYLAPSFGWWLPGAEQLAALLFFLFLCFLLLPTATLLQRWPRDVLEAALADEGEEA